MQKISKVPLFYRYNQEQDNDNLVIISSHKGFGKSNLSFYEAFDYLRMFGCKCKDCKYTWAYTGKVMHNLNLLKDAFDTCKLCGKRIKVGLDWKDFTKEDVWKYIAYSTDIFDKINKLEPFSPIVADEGVNFAMGEDWMLGENKRIKRLFAQCRTKHLTIFINIPKFSWVQKKYRDDMATAWLRILVRGLTLMLIPDLGEGKDAWHLDEFDKLLGSYNIMTSKEELQAKAHKLKSKHPCYYDHFFVPKVPDRIYELYLQIRDYFVYSQKESISKGELYKLMCYNLRYRWKELKDSSKGRRFPSGRIIADNILYNPITKKTEITEGTVKNVITEMRKRFKDKETIVS